MTVPTRSARVTEIKGFVRWPTEVDTWIEPREYMPEGHRIAIIDEFVRPGGGGQWLAEDRVPARACRFTVGPGRALCRRPSVAVLDRGSWSNRPNRWGYCERHLYGRRFEDGKMLSAILVPAA